MDNLDCDWKKSKGVPEPKDLLVALGESDSRGSKIGFLFFGWVIDNGETSFSMPLVCGSMLPIDRIGPPNRSACCSVLILLGLYVYLKYFKARIGPIPAATMSCNGCKIG